MITVDMPYPPSVNNLFVNVQGKGRRKSKRYEEWSHVAHMEIMAQRPQWRIQHICGPVSISIVLERRGRPIDIDNGAKALIDALVKMKLIDDDRNVQRLTVEHGDVKGARVTVTAYAEAAA